jgi:T5SS/PEP-CTERM-associated repeat protein
VASNWVGNYYVGGNYVFDALQIINGGALSNGAAYIGYTQTGTSNNALVTGTGSSWTIQDQLQIGWSSRGNSLVISNGGTVIVNRGPGSDTGKGVVGGAGTNNTVLVTGSGSVWSNGQQIDVGSYGSGNSLVINNGGTVLSSRGEIGFYGGTSNRVVVSGNGSAWTMQDELLVGWTGRGNSLVISNGGTVIVNLGAGPDTGKGVVGGAGTNNSALVTGSGSLWNIGRQIDVGSYGSGNSLVINNGGKVLSSRGEIGFYGGTNNGVLVTGDGSVWTNQGSLYIGRYSGSGNSLVINDGGTVVSSNLVVGFDTTASDNFATLNGGNLIVRNASGNTALDVGRGMLTLNSGNITADRLVATNGASGRITFNGGTLNTKGTTINNGSPLTVGNGSSAATLNLQGGTHSFANGLVISSNAVLKGTGIIQANLTLAGTLSPGSSAGAITNFGNLSLQSSAVLQFELGGTTQGSEYDFILVTNGVATLDGLLQVGFINGFQTNVLNSNTFTLLTATNVLTGSFTDVLSGERLMTADGEGSFLVSYSDNNLVLSDYQVIPEPGTLALCALGLAGLFVARQRRLRQRVPPSG